MKVLIDKQYLINIAEKLKNKLNQGLLYFPLDYANLIKAIDDVTTGGQLDLSDYFKTYIDCSSNSNYQDLSYCSLSKVAKELPEN